MFTTPYGQVLSIKILFALLAFSLAVYMTYLSNKIPNLEPSIRVSVINIMSKIAKTQIVLGLIIVFLAVYLRNEG